MMQENFEQKKKEIQDSRKKLTESKNKLKNNKLYFETKAAHYDNEQHYPTFSDLALVMEQVDDMLSFFDRQLVRLEEDVFALQQNPIANVKSREQMQRIIDNLGLSDEMEVQKKQIFLFD